MVIGYALLGFSEWHQDSVAALRKADLVLAPDLLRVELLSALWQHARKRAVAPEATFELLRDGELLVDELVPAGELLEAALSLALDRDHSPYDTLFVALALRRETRLLTYDGGLLGKFPETAISVSQFLDS